MMHRRANKRDLKHCTRFMNILFQTCYNPEASLAEFKDQLEHSNFAAGIRDDAWMKQTKEEQKLEINRYITYDDGVTILADKLGFSDEQREKYRKRENDTVIRMFYRSPSTRVLTSELIKNMTHCDKRYAVAPGKELNKMPERNSPPSILDTALFVNNEPAKIQWPVFSKWIADFYDYSMLVLVADEEFFKLQITKSDTHLPPKYVEGDGLERDHQDYAVPVKFMTFFESFRDNVCFPLIIDEVIPIENSKSTPNVQMKRQINALKSHKFWSTETGRLWYHQYEKERNQIGITDHHRLITWEAVYRGLVDMVPKFLFIDDIAAQHREYFKPAHTGLMSSQLGFIFGTGLIKITDQDQTLPEADPSVLIDEGNDDDVEGNAEQQPFPKKKQSILSKFFRLFYKSNPAPGDENDDNEENSTSAKSESSSTSTSSSTNNQPQDSGAVTFKKHYKTRSQTRQMA